MLIHVWVPKKKLEILISSSRRLFVLLFIITARQFITDSHCIQLLSLRVKPYATFFSSSLDESQAATSIKQSELRNSLVSVH